MDAAVLLTAPENCETCRHSDGFCTCKEGWLGFNCTKGMYQSKKKIED